MDPDLRRRATRSEQAEYDAHQRGDDLDPHKDCEDVPCDECRHDHAAEVADQEFEADAFSAYRGGM